MYESEVIADVLQENVERVFQIEARDGFKIAYMKVCIRKVPIVQCRCLLV